MKGNYLSGGNGLFNDDNGGKGVLSSVKRRKKRKFWVSGVRRSTSVLNQIEGGETTLKDPRGDPREGSNLLRKRSTYVSGRGRLTIDPRERHHSFPLRMEAFVHCWGGKGEKSFFLGYSGGAQAGDRERNASGRLQK